MTTQMDPQATSLETVQKAYKHYDLSLLGLIAFLILRGVIFGMVPLTKVLVVSFGVINLILAVFVVVCVYRMGRQLKLNGADKTPSFLWPIAMFLPLVNLICIFVMYGKARKLIKKMKAENAA